MVVQRNLLENAYFIAKMFGQAMIQPANSDFWKAPYEWMECVGRNLITRVLTSRDTYTKHNVVDVWALLLTSPALL